MTPDEEAIMRAQLSGASAPAPDVWDRMRDSGRRLASNPVVQAAGRGLLGPALGPLAGAAGSAMPGPDPRQPTSFTRDVPPAPEPLQLQPMASGPDLTLPNTPTLAGYKASQSQAGGGGGSMAGLASAYRNSQADQFRTFGKEQNLVGERGQLQTQRIDKLSDMQELDAARKIRDAEVKAQHDAEINARHDAFLARNQQLADDIGQQKIDPSKVIGDMSAGQKLGWVIAGALSGASGQGPALMQRLDSLVDQGVKAQIANVDNKKAALSARNNVFQQMMAESGDRKTAEAQTRALIYTAINQKLESDAARLGNPEIMNNAELVKNQIAETKINPLQTQIAGNALQAAQAQEAATAAAQRQAEEHAWNRSMQVAELGIKTDAAKLERDKFDAENGAGSGGLGKAGRQAIALEEAKTQRELNAILAAVTSAQKDVAAITRGGTFGHAYAGLPAWVPGADVARKDVNAREAFNALVRPGVGAAWKMRTGGVEPKNPGILDEQARAFTVQPSDSEAVVNDRMERFRKHMTESAAAQGATVEMPPTVPVER